MAIARPPQHAYPARPVDLRPAGASLATVTTFVNIGDWALVRPYLNDAPYFASKGTIPALKRPEVDRRTWQC